MKFRIFLVISILNNFLYSQTPLAPSIPVTDSYFGAKIVDEYRNLENLTDPDTKRWINIQNDYTDLILDKIPRNNYYLNKRLELEKRQGYFISELKIIENNKYFYLKRNGDEKIAKLYCRNGYDGKEELLYDPINFISSSKSSGKDNEFKINLISPSWDGSRVAISLSEKGKEISEIIILEVKDRTIHPEIITHANPSSIAGVKWLDDNSGFFYVYYPVIDPKSQLFAKNTQVVLHKLGEDPNHRRDVFSKKNNSELNIAAEKYPGILAFNPDDQYYIGMVVDAEDYRDTFIINKDDFFKNKKNWKSLYKKDDKVFYVRLAGNDIYFLSGYNSSNFKLCKTSAQNPNFRNPEVLVPEYKDEVFKSYVITKDGIYYTTTKNGVEAKLYLYRKGQQKLIKLPYVSGNINLQAKGQKFSDIWINCSGWANDEQRYKYELKDDKFILENLVPIIDYPEFKDIVVEEITVKSYDGEDIPLSIIYNKALKKDGKSPMLIYGYGAYGESYRPFFARSYLIWANQGGIMAIAHVRGGGEKGEKWHLDGRKIKKANSWKDLISCTEYMINQKYTSPDKIAVWGQSGGGVLMGRAITERPDLFKAAIIEVGSLNTLRGKLNGIGGTDADEFGNIDDPEGFKSLLEMDSYHHIKKNVEYPATLLITGMNDTRVAPWQSVKFAAKLSAYKKPNNPTLLKVSMDSGHGVEDPAYKIHERNSLIYAFAFWQLGHPDYQPVEEIKK